MACSPIDLGAIFRSDCISRLSINLGGAKRGRRLLLKRRVRNLKSDGRIIYSM